MLNKKNNFDDNKENVNFNRFNYNLNMLTRIQMVAIFMGAFICGALVIYLFYKKIYISILISIPISFYILRKSKLSSIKNRKIKLRLQFKDLLDSMYVSMRAGSNEIAAIRSAKNELLLTYPKTADIICEIDKIISDYQNNIKLSVSFNNLAERSGIEDIKSFSQIFETIEGKSSRSIDIIKQTTEIIADKIQIETDIETKIIGTKREQSIMFAMPILIIIVMNLGGGAFLDSLYTTVIGRIVSTLVLIIITISYLWAQKILDIKI